MTEMPHTHKSFDLDLDELTDKLSEMFQKTEIQVNRMIQVLGDRNQTTIEALIFGDGAINQLCGDIDRLTVKLLALRQPVAVDLRKVIGALKISNDLERIADYCVNIGRQITAVSGDKQSRSMDSITGMAEKAQNMVGLSFRAFQGLDVKLAQEIVNLDDEVDSLYASLLTWLQEEMAENSGLVETCSHLLHIARHLERVADHAVNVGQHVKYIATGRRDQSEEK